jgi:hypothetical protein
MITDESNDEIDEDEEEDPILTRDRLAMEAEYKADRNFLKNSTFKGSKGMKNALSLATSN